MEGKRSRAASRYMAEIGSEGGRRGVLGKGAWGSERLPDGQKNPPRGPAGGPHRRGGGRGTAEETSVKAKGRRQLGETGEVVGKEVGFRPKKNGRGVGGDKVVEVAD